MHLLSVISIFSVMVLAAAKTGPSHNKIVVCYISTWAVYRNNKGSYAIDHFDPNLCTHAIYAFSGLDAETDSIKSMDPWQDLKDNYGKGGYESLTNFKQTYPHLKVLLAIGGWNEGSTNYSRMAADSERRKRFVKSALDFVLKYKFDGLDLDWEYPTQRGGQPFDKDNFVLLAKDLKDSFRPHKLLLTSAFGAAKNTIDEAYDIPALSKYLDFLHIMCYDYGGVWDGRITANAPLKGQGILNVGYSIDYLIKLGAPPSKIVMGIPFYGRTFVTQLNGDFDDVISNNIGFKGTYTGEPGFMGYNEICVLTSDRNSGWKRSYDTERNQAVAKFKDEQTGETRVAVYDSSRSIANKMKFAMSHNLAGAMIWSVDTDDFHGDCDVDNDTFDDFKPMAGVNLTRPKRYNANYPLLRTVNEAIVLSLDEIAQEANLNRMAKDNEIPHGDNEDDKGAAPYLLFNVQVIFVSIFVHLITRKYH